MHMSLVRDICIAEKRAKSTHSMGWFNEAQNYGDLLNEGVELLSSEGIDYASLERNNMRVKIMEIRESKSSSFNCYYGSVNSEEISVLARYHGDEGITFVVSESDLYLGMKTNSFDSRLERIWSRKKTLFTDYYYLNEGIVYDILTLPEAIASTHNYGHIFIDRIDCWTEGQIKKLLDGVSISVSVGYSWIDTKQLGSLRAWIRVYERYCLVSKFMDISDALEQMMWKQRSEEDIEDINDLKELDSKMLDVFLSSDELGAMVAEQVDIVEMFKTKLCIPADNIVDILRRRDLVELHGQDGMFTCVVETYRNESDEIVYDVDEFYVSFISGRSLSLTTRDMGLDLFMDHLEKYMRENKVTSYSKDNMEYIMKYCREVVRAHYDKCVAFWRYFNKYNISTENNLVKIVLFGEELSRSTLTKEGLEIHDQISNLLFKYGKVSEQCILRKK